MAATGCSDAADAVVAAGGGTAAIAPATEDERCSNAVATVATNTTRLRAQAVPELPLSCAT